MAAMAGGMPNANQLLNALNNLTNALGVGGNNMQNVNNALNNLNAVVTANNNAMLNRGVQAAPVLTFYGRNQDTITWLNEFNNACAANGWNAARKLQVMPAYLKGTAAVWWQTVVNNPINAWGGAANNNTFEH
ncbi:4648_t:CDS:1, partial [Rhizophagus irregularis]